MFDIGSFECLSSIKAHASGIRDLCALENGFIASASYDKTIKVWDVLGQSEGRVRTISALTKASSSDNVQTGRVLNLVMTLNGHLSSVLCLSYIGQSKLVSGSGDYTIKAWDLNEG